MILINHLQILEALTATKTTSPNLDFSLIASETEGYLPADLRTLINRAYDASIMRWMEADVLNDADEVQMDEDDFRVAMEGFVPAALKGVKLVDSETSWADIGGMYVELILSIYI
jgi:peroxin-1